MSQFLKKRAKLIYILMFAFSLFIFVSSTVYITAYNSTAVSYTVEVTENPNATSMEGNVDILDFIKKLHNLNKSGVEGADFPFKYGSFENNQTYVVNYKTNYSNFDIAFRSLYDFNQTLQLTNNTLFYLGLFALAMVAIMCICANASRKKYYISNLVSGIVCPAATIGFTVVTLFFNIKSMLFLGKHWDLLNWSALANENIPKEKFEISGLPFEDTPVLKWFVEGDTSHYILNYNSLIIYTVFLVAFIACNGLLIAYNVYRYLDTKKELQLEGLGD